MFGSNIEFRYLKYSNKSWKEFIRNEYKFDNLKGETLTIFDNWLSKIPLKIEKTLDFLWLLNFCCKWEFVVNSASMLTGFDFGNRVIPFFNTRDFEVYACHYERTSIADIKNYKLPLKNFIYDVIKDKDYFENKGKVRSQRIFYGVTSEIFDDNPKLTVLESGGNICSYNIDPVICDNKNELKKWIINEILAKKYNIIL